MKVSKVNHTRTAVSRQLNDRNKDLVREQSSIEGILYKNPSQKKSVQEDLEDHIRELNKKAQGLYNVFHTTIKKKNGSNYRDNEKDIIRNKIINNFNKITKWLVRMTYRVSEEEAIRKQFNRLDNFVSEKIPIGRDRQTREEIKKTGGNLFRSKDFSKVDFEKTVNEIVDQRLRNSLRIYVTDIETKERIYIPDVFKQLMYAFCMGEGYKTAYAQIPKNQIKLALQVMNADYTREKQITNTAKAIRNQNVKVQPDQEGILQLSGAGHVDEKKDYKSKKYIFDFVKEYACLDRREREEKLRHMRLLIVLYFYGEEMYQNPPKGITAFSFGKELAMDEGIFSEEALGKLNEDGTRCQNKTKQAEVRECLRGEMSERYHKFFGVEKVVLNPTLEKSDYFWLNWIIGEVETIFYGNSNGKKTVMNKKQLSLMYLCKRVWNNWTAFIAMKYVDMGKAVHHFAMPDLSSFSNGEEIAFGELQPQYREGLTSFDYERIKADESLERGLSTYITFAANTFAQASIGEEFRIKNADIFYNESGADSFLDGSYSDSTRRVLQYFGGQSNWENSDIIQWDRIDLLETMRQALRFVRDGSIHYTSVHNTDSSMNTELLQKMYDKEVSDIGQLYTEKYCSNNVLMFYSPADTLAFMKKVYQKNGVERRMPAFKNVVRRKDMRETIKKLAGEEYYNTNISSMEPDLLCKLEATQYFLLSEIYYNDFIVADDTLQLFVDEVNRLDTKDRKNGNAAKDFKARVNDIKSNCTLETLCEIIMTDYSMQNTDKEKIAFKDTGTDKDKRIYKHFPILLRQCVGQAFLQYVSDKDEYSLLRKPRLCENRETVASAEEKLREKGKELKIVMCQNEEIRQDDRLMAWYAVVHFLSPKYLNQLSGLFFSYIQMVNNINNRARMTGNRQVDYKEKIGYYQKIIQVLGLVRNYAARISTDITDYFDGTKAQATEAYAGYLSDYVAFYEENDSRSYAMALKEFAMQKVEKGSPSGYVGIYFDGDNPILNRNVILTMLYGNIRSVRETVKKKKITLQEIKGFYEQQEKLQSVLSSGICHDKKEQQAYKDFQLQKNRIELVDVRTFTEIINDLHAKLISWSYLRERDLLYFQLGVHYLRLQYSKDIGEEDLQKEILGDNVRITDGGILYQLLALNTHTLPLYKKQGKPVPRGNVGTKLGSFLKTYGYETYTCGLEMFEHIAEHDDIIGERNYFDHFKYYGIADQSIMDMYGEVYDRFFTYDLKLQKSVTYILSDILKDYFVLAEIGLGGERIICNKNPNAQKGDQYTRKTRYPVISRDLEADECTYKLNVQQKGNAREIKVNTPARTDIFLKQLKELLEYKVVNEN